VALGYNSQAARYGAAALGYYARAGYRSGYGDWCLAGGAFAVAYGHGAVALGYYSGAGDMWSGSDVYYPVALGCWARAVSDYSVAVGAWSQATEYYTFAVGDGSMGIIRRRIVGVAPGTGDYDAVTVGQLRALGMNI
jgi:hypothetical protein